MSTLQQFQLNKQNIKIQPVATKVFRKEPCGIGSKVMYASSRGGYNFGYYLGLDNGNNAVCVLSSWRRLSFSRIEPHRVLAFEWDSSHIGDATSEKLLMDTLVEYRQQV